MNKFIIILFVSIIYPFQLYAQDNTPELIINLVKEKDIVRVLSENDWEIQQIGEEKQTLKNVWSTEYIATKDYDRVIIKDYKGKSNHIKYEPYYYQSSEKFLDIIQETLFREIESHSYSGMVFRLKDVICIFTDSLIKVFNAKEEEDRVKVLESMNSERIELLENISLSISLADSLNLLGEYGKSLIRYSHVIDKIDNIPEYFSPDIIPSNLKNDIINKIALIHEKQKAEEIQISIENGDQLFNEGIYNKSLEIFNYVLSLDKNNKIAKTKISEIEKIQSILRDRRTKTFSYSVIEKNRYVNLENNITKKLEQSIDNSKKGSINLNCFLSFDTLGSSDLNISCSSNVLEDYISKLYKDLTAYPPKIKDFNLSTKDSINIKLNWVTKKVSFKFNSHSLTSNSIKAWNRNMYVHNEKAYIEDYIKDNGFGKYKFNVKKKDINNTTLYDYSLLQYTVRGPSNALYSIILPGLGSYRTSYGEKGKNRYKSIMVFSAIAYGSKLLSKSQYRVYKRYII